MSDLSPEQVQYQKEYDAAIEAIDAGAAPAIPPEKVEAAPVQAPAEPEAPKVEAVAEPVDEMATMRERLERAEKQAADNKAWATKEAQRRAELERQYQQQQREASRPAILDANPELVEAIKFVASDPAPQQAAEDASQRFNAAIEAVHPGIFAADADPELIDALVKRRDADPAAWFSDPTVASRLIAEEKVAHAERVASKRFAIEADKLKAKTAMSVPGTGGAPARVAVDPQADEANRIKNMSDADFAKEVRKVKGY